MRSTRRHSYAVLYLLLPIGLVLLAAVGAVTGYEFRHAEHVYPGVSLVVPTANGPLQMEMGGLTRAEAADHLRIIFTPYPGPATILRYGNQTWAYSASDLGVELDAAATAESAFAEGRGDTLWGDLFRQWYLYRFGATTLPVLRYDDGQEAYILGRLAREINKPAREGVLRLNGLQIISAQGETGREMDIAESRAVLHEHLVRGGSAEVKLVVREIHPVLENVESAAAQVQQVIQGPLSLAFRDGKDEFQAIITPEMLAAWLAFRQEAGADGRATLTARLDEDQVRAYAAKELSAILTREPRDGAFIFNPENRVLTATVPSRNGWRPNVAEIARRIVTAAFSDERGVPLAVDLIKPEIASEDVGKMGIKELVAQGSTSFAGSSKERIQNIIAAASKFQNVVVPPGGIFSFNRHVGDISKENGFAEGLIIWGDRTAVGVGGGVCQVSTTAFRAAFWGGFPIVERSAHGYVVSWYGEPGLDATIFAPSVDFKFRNDMPNSLLIQTDVDLKAGKVTFNFYGTKVERTVEITERKVENIQPAPTPIYQENLSLKSGEKKQVDWAKEGKDVTIRRVVKQDGKNVHEDTFVSNYRPWAAVFLVGPPKDKPVTTTPGPTVTVSATPVAMPSVTPTPLPVPTATPTANR